MGMVFTLSMHPRHTRNHGHRPQIQLREHPPGQPYRNYKQGNKHDQGNGVPDAVFRKVHVQQEINLCDNRQSGATRDRQQQSEGGNRCPLTRTVAAAMSSDATIKPVT
ncbi:hypothetical protein [Acidithiobacillus ferrivorans]|uniref:hypothetical protein n=1 Tax=Acidithiobacillus ferrivorans TaxID=160808 RepID=UPI0013053DFB|nr:hypothetical protein [Acidithiobacillus ferrivorans]